MRMWIELTKMYVLKNYPYVFNLSILYLFKFHSKYFYMYVILYHKL